MGQGEVLKQLSSTEWRTIRDISLRIGIEESATSNGLRRLYKHGEVLRRKIFTKNHWKYEYKLK